MPTESDMHSCSENVVFYHNKMGTLWTLCSKCGRVKQPSGDDRRAFQAGIEFERARLTSGIRRGLDSLVGPRRSGGYYTEMKAE